MSTTVPITVGSARSMASGVRLALVTVAVAVLLIVSFIVGRATTTTPHGKTTITPTAQVQPDPFACPRHGPC